MKKVNRVATFMSIILMFIISIFDSSLVSSASFDFEGAKYQVTRVLDSALGILSPFLEMIIGDYSSSQFFFYKVLLFILLLVIIKNLLEKTPIGSENKTASLIISIIISILGIRFINENDFFEAIFIQYGTLGIAITTIIPLVIFFYFVNNIKVGTYGRKIFWTLYIITMSAIWITKSSQIPEVANWIYGLNIVAAIIFILFDKTIQAYFGLSELKNWNKWDNRRRIRDAKAEIDKLKDHFHHGRISLPDFKKEKAKWEEYIKELSKE